MCIFSQPVIAVNNTKIFARLSGQGTQFLAYQMTYESRDANAMILPIPVRQPASEKAVQFINLKRYGDFFEHLDSGFPFVSPGAIGCSAPPKSADLSMLKVFEVGSYIASFVPSLADFERVDPRFKLPMEIWEQIPEYKDFGFAVFQLAAGTLKPHPMAFEFQSLNDELFFPTIHIHDGEVHDQEEFDHVLYMQHAGLDSRVGRYQNSFIADRATGVVRSKNRASNFCDIDRAKKLLLGNLLVHREILRGKLPNQDVKVAPLGDPVRRTLNFNSLSAFAPWLTVVAAACWCVLRWFFKRRATINGADKD